MSIYGNSMSVTLRRDCNGEFIALVAGKLSMDPRAAS